MVEVQIDGIPCCFEKDVLDDIEMVENVLKLQQGNATVVVPIALSLYGAEQYDNIKSQLRDESGRCRLSAISDFVSKTLIEVGKANRSELKN